MQHHLCKWYCEINVVVLLSVQNARFEFVGSVVRRIKFSRDHLFVAKNRKSKTKQNTRKQLSFWLTKNWCSGLKINVAETGPVHGMGVGALKSRDHSLCACNCDAWENTNTGSLSFRFSLTLFLLLVFFLFVLFCFFHGDSLSLSCKKYHRVAYMAMMLNRPHPATQPVLSKPTLLFSVWQEKQEGEKRLKEWISRPKHKNPWPWVTLQTGERFS